MNPPCTHALPHVGQWCHGLLVQMTLSPVPCKLNMVVIMHLVIDSAGNIEKVCVIALQALEHQKVW